MSACAYEVRLAPGCYSGPDAPLVSRHRTLRAAVRQVRRSNRWVVEPASSSVILWRATEYRAGDHGPGLYGQPELRSLEACLREAQAADAAWRAQ